MDNLELERQRLLGSLLDFTRVFYKLRTGREFKISNPVSREPHVITVTRELEKLFKLETNRLIINIPPGHGKSELMIHFVAWAFAHYPDCAFIYVSYSHELAAKHTYTIKQIMQMPHYKRLFGVEIKRDSSAKDNFRTTAGGAVKAFGSGGAITGQDAGLPGLNRFTGCVIMDDMHKPDEVHSDTIREKVKSNFIETISQRPRDFKVPIVFIGQRLHEDDLPANLLNSFDGKVWAGVILKAIDDAGNALNPEVKPLSELKSMQEHMPYVFASQHQQDPQPAGGGILKPDWFVLTDDEPEIISTFIVVDTAETDKNYNDATVFSFFGIYDIKFKGELTGLQGLHWIDCYECRIEPKDLQPEFFQFYTDCMRHSIKPKIAAIEKKSTGSTLLSMMKELQGLRLIDIERNRSTGNKTKRFLDAQPYLAAKQISLPRYGKHTHMCLEHCRKITANETHRWDDIADTLADGIRLALAEKAISVKNTSPAQANQQAQTLMQNYNRLKQAKGNSYGITR